MTAGTRLVIEPLARGHDRAAFSCGVAELDRYIARQAGQDMRRRVARVFVCVPEGSSGILGYYTLSALSIDLGALPPEQARKLPRHPVPCALIGRLAVDLSGRGRGLGRLLLADAIKRAVGAGSSLAIHAMVVDALNEEAKAFYRAFGFTQLQDTPMRLFLPLGGLEW
ncbi:GNAT family N-acetyltransferase [Marinimicrococcus flavescens]|uniref:GNAT family N-acetyltransferase n=1 Tax=Marinimicrococcus flavescens TaxID=3031815 RepID=A0AAP3V0B5_9PROT|nr:GNAT family N-acetyltransferase [Marinimicrococcus flavescens]